MKPSHLHLALREIRDMMRQPRVIAVLMAVVLVATVAQPFGFRVPGHIGLTFIYWLLVVWICFPMGSLISLMFEKSNRSMHRLLRIGCASICMGLATTCVIYLLNMVFLQWPLLNAARWIAIGTTAFPTAAIVTFGMGVGLGDNAGASPQAPQAPTLLDRLAFDLRGPILHLTAEDHYTKVTTTKGQALVLIRFVDAVAEAAPTQGLQTHRSHWVAVAGITSVKRQGDGAVLTLSNGTDVPVSRSRLGDLKDLGIL